MTTTNTTAAPAAKKYDEQQRFEFLLYINNHIICQRYFNIRDYNEDVIQSSEMKDLIDSIVGMDTDGFGGMGIIPKHLKNKSVDYSWANYRPYDLQVEEGNKNIFEKIDNFQFEIKVDKNSVAKAQFSGNFFPPKVRYAVDIKEIIPSIMTEIRNYFSQKNYNKVEASQAL